MTLKDIMAFGIVVYVVLDCNGRNGAQAMKAGAVDV